MALTLHARAVIGLAASCAASSLLAGTIRHDVDPQVHVDYGDQIRLVGGVTVFPSFGSGVAITREWVLTAAHVVYPVISGGVSVGFETDPHPDEVVDPEFPYPLSGVFYADQVAIHEFYDDGLGPAGGFDIALIHLDQPIEQYAPHPIFRANPVTNPELGRVGTAVGFGATGDGITGYDVATGGFFRLAGDNMIDGIADDPRIVDQFVSRTVVDSQSGQTLHFTREQIAAQFMMSDFDDPATDALWTNDGLNPLGSETPLPLEYEVAPGDSGGPLMTLVNGEYQVMGINSWIYGLPAPWGDTTDNASYGDVAGYLRVAAFNEWIDSVIGPTVPEPGGIGVSLFFLGSLLLNRGRRASDKPQPA